MPGLTFGSAVPDIARLNCGGAEPLHVCPSNACARYGDSLPEAKYSGASDRCDLGPYLGPSLLRIYRRSQRENNAFVPLLLPLSVSLIPTQDRDHPASIPLFFSFFPPDFWATPGSSLGLLLTLY